MKELIEKALKSLSQKRPIFHSESDFQFSLAWEFQLLNSKDFGLRLEKPITKPKRLKQIEENRESNIYADIFLEAENIAIELKYKTHSYHDIIQGEQFNLKSHAAHILGIYDFIHDVFRLESLRDDDTIKKGYAIFLTNDHLYWEKKPGSSKMSNDFYLMDGSKLKKKIHKWKIYNTNSITQKRNHDIPIGTEYDLKWVDYGEKGFKYLLLEV